MTRSQMFNTARLEPQYPMSLGVLQQYDGAQHAMGWLAGQGFPVQNLEADGTELRTVERVTGRMTRGQIDPRVNYSRACHHRARRNPAPRTALTTPTTVRTQDSPHTQA